MSTELRPETPGSDVSSIVQEKALIDRLRSWINAFDPTEKTFADFEEGMVRENSAFFELVKARQASENLLSWHDGLMGEADASGYFIGSQDLVAEWEEVEPNRDWYIRPEDRARFGNERRLVDPNQLPLF